MFAKKIDSTERKKYKIQNKFEDQQEELKGKEKIIEDFENQLKIENEEYLFEEVNNLKEEIKILKSEIQMETNELRNKEIIIKSLQNILNFKT
jgi:hypothetical protein